MPILIVFLLGNVSVSAFKTLSTMMPIFYWQKKLSPIPASQLNALLVYSVEYRM
jgi:hypothetical protein